MTARWCQFRLWFICGASTYTVNPLSVQHRNLNQRTMLLYVTISRHHSCSMESNYTRLDVLRPCHWIFWTSVKTYSLASCSSFGNKHIFVAETYIFRTISPEIIDFAVGRLVVQLGIRPLNTLDMEHRCWTTPSGRWKPLRIRPKISAGTCHSAKETRRTVDCFYFCVARWNDVGCQCIWHVPCQPIYIPSNRTHSCWTS